MTRHPVLAYADDVDFGDEPERRTQWSPDRFREDNARLRRLVIDICRDLGARLDESPSRAALRVMQELDKATRRLEVAENRLKKEKARRAARNKDRQKLQTLRAENARLRGLIAVLKVGAP